MSNSDSFRLYRAFWDADKAWQAELKRLFGSKAGDVRYTKEGEGSPGTELNITYLAFRDAGDAWRKSV